jgi:hypothetical protein
MASSEWNASLSRHLPSSPRRKPGPITTSLGLCGRYLPPCLIETSRGMGPGSRFAWPGRRMEVGLLTSSLHICKQDILLQLAARCARGDAKPSARRAWGMPGAQCTRSLVCAWCSQDAHEYSQRSHRKSPGIPARNGFNGFLRALLGDRAFLSPSLPDKRPIRARSGRSAIRQFDAGVEASGPHDFAVRSTVVRPRAV